MLALAKYVSDLVVAQLGERLIFLFPRERHDITLTVVNHADLFRKEDNLVNVEPEFLPRLLEAVTIILRQERSRCEVSKIDEIMVAIILAEHGFSGDVIL